MRLAENDWNESARSLSIRKDPQRESGIMRQH